MKNGVIIVFVATLAFAASACSAAIITIAIEGVVDSVVDPLGKLNSSIGTGSTILGTYSFDTTAPDSSDLSSVGDYRQEGTSTQIAITINSLTFASVVGTPNYTIGIINNKLGRDRYYVGSTTNMNTNSLSIAEISWNLEDHTESAFNSIDLPLTPPDLSNWDINSFRISENACAEENFDIYGHITSAVLVPEPTLISLLAAGLLAIRRRSL